jgi:hypothetical protein
VLRSRSLLAVLLVACGPSTGEPVGPASDTGSGTTSDGDASTNTSSASGGVDTGSTSDGTSSTGEAFPAELPPEMAGDWVCSGWEDSIFLELDVVGATMAWSGSACGPYTVDGAFPMVCDSLVFGDPSLSGTQAYWSFELDYTKFGVDVRYIDMAMDHVPQTDTLEGVLVLDDGNPIPELCERFMR